MFAALVGALFCPAVFADWTLNLTEGVTPISREIFRLHMIVMWICVCIGIVVFSVMFWSILHHRKSKGAKAAHFHESTAVEVAWTIVPFLILVGMAIPATRALIKMENAGGADLSILVTGYQWKWHYKYMEDDIEFFSNLDADSNKARGVRSGVDPKTVDHYLLNVDNAVVVPTNKKIRFLTTANDVIHAWWVPALGFKRDAIPGFVNESWAYIEEPGVYRGQCAELCGRDHAFMPIVVVAKEESEYRKWVDEFKAARAAEALANDPNREWSMEELMQRGAAIYASICSACRTPDGAPVPGTFGEIAADPAILGDIEDAIDLVMFGKGETKGYKDQLSDVDLAALITYVRNAEGASVGDSLQPSVIKDYR